MVTYDLYVHILRATMPCSGTKSKGYEQLLYLFLKIQLNIRLVLSD